MKAFFVASSVCFNPHPHAEGDCVKDICFSPVDVSIHTLTRRVTVAFWSISVAGTVSIHTLTRRVTVPVKYTELMYIVSIHTLTRRVTVSREYFIHRTTSFNPHPHAEGDICTAN